MTPPMVWENLRFGAPPLLGFSGWATVVPILILKRKWVCLLLLYHWPCWQKITSISHVALKSNLQFTFDSLAICEPAILRIAYCVCFCVFVSCLTFHANRAYSIGFHWVHRQGTHPSTIPDCLHLLFMYPLLDTVSAEYRSLFTGSGWFLEFQSGPESFSKQLWKNLSSTWTTALYFYMLACELPVKWHLDRYNTHLLSIRRPSYKNIVLPSRQRRSSSAC